jgi:membrane protease YdiL (CAAX protease family)
MMDEAKPSLFWRIFSSAPVRLFLSLLACGLLTKLAVSQLDKLHLMPGKGEQMRAGVATALEAWLALTSTIVLLVIGRTVERASYTQLGLPHTGVVRQTGIGFGLGAGLLSLVVAIMAIAGWYQVSAFGGPGVVGPFLLSILLFLLVGIYEEVLFRGIAFRLLEQMIGTWGAVLLTAALFGLSHLGNPNATWISGLGIAIEAGVLLAGAYLLFRALWLPIGMHWAWNLFEGPVYGTPVSGMDLPTIAKADVHGPVLWTGGMFGPEAGLVCMVLGGVFGIALMVVAHRRGQIFTPHWMLKLVGRGSPEAPATPA